jgi:hypothetical protein
MSDADKKDQLPPIHWVESQDGVFEVYANMVNITWTLDDLRIRVAQLIPSPESRTPGDKYVPLAEERAAVTMTWRNAKIFCQHLTSVIESFEKANWPIKVDVKLPAP